MFKCHRPVTLLKKTLAQVFSCEFSEIFKNSYFYRTPLVAASVFTSWVQTCSKWLRRLNKSLQNLNFKFKNFSKN